MAASGPSAIIISTASAALVMLSSIISRSLSEKCPSTGNPDRKYQNTRHNIGFEVIDAIAGKNQITVGERKHKAIIGKGYVGGRKVVLVKPQTYMNLSGES